LRPWWSHGPFGRENVTLWVGWAKAVGQAGAGVNTRGRDVIDVIEATPTRLGSTVVEVMGFSVSSKASKSHER